MPDLVERVYDNTRPRAFSGGRPERNAEPADHLIRLPGSRWALWRCVGLRGAGFPASLVLSLSLDSCSAAADSLICLEQQRDAARERASAGVNSALDALKEEQAWDDKSRRDPLLKALRDLKGGKTPKPLPEHTSINDLIEQYKAAHSDAKSAAVEFQKQFENGVHDASQSIRNLAARSDFQEAVTWQNRQGFDSGINVLLQRPAGGPRGSKQRQHEELIASYLQRYSVKNDTIGFFGPVGWASMEDAGEAIRTSPGSGLLATRKVYFEGWCIEALAERLCENPGMKLWAAPRVMPFIRLEGNALHVPSSPPISLSAKQTALLRCCNGRSSAIAIATSLVNNHDFSSTEEVYNLLGGFNDSGLISWRFEIPIESHPEATLRRLLQQVGDEALRANGLRALDELENKRDLIASSCGNPRKLGEAMADLEAAFTRLTGSASTRAAGKTYAGRTLVFEDCRRDITVELGPEFIREIAAPMSLLLASARWVTYQIANLYRKAFKETYEKIARETGSLTIDAVRFWLDVQDILMSDRDCPGDIVEPMVQERWFRLLAPPEGSRQVSYRSEDLKPRVLAAFRAPRAGWQFGRYHSPDIMIAASSPEAIRSGDYQVVVGELHCGLNTLGASLFVNQHPEPEWAFNAVDADLTQARLVPVNPKSWRIATLRTRQVLKSPKDIFVALARDSVPEPGMSAIPISEMVVTSRSGGLSISTRDGRISMDLIEAFGDILSAFSANSLTLLRPDAHTPRITIDRLIVCREAWRLTPSEAPFAWMKDEAARFLAARRWADSHSMPRFVFVKVPAERKPFYLDFNSPIYVDIFAKMIRRSEEETSKRITISEMIPSINECWLPDSRGESYTSELRIVALDLDG